MAKKDIISRKNHNDTLNWAVKGVNLKRSSLTWDSGLIDRGGGHRRGGGNLCETHSSSFKLPCLVFTKF